MCVAGSHLLMTSLIRRIFGGARIRENDKEPKKSVVVVVGTSLTDNPPPSSTMRLLVSLLLLLLVAAVIGTSNAFAPKAIPQGALSLSQTGRVFQHPSWSSTRSSGNNQNDQSLWQQPQSQPQQYQFSSFSSTSLFSDAWDEDVDYDKEWPSGSGGDQMNLPDEQDMLQQLSSSNAASTNMDELRMTDRDILDEVKEELGVDLNLRLGDDELDEIKEKAREIIEKKVQENVNQVNRMRERMNREIERNRNMMQTQSELKGKKESARLLSKIDRMTEDFLQSTSAARESTQRAAAADKSMEGKGVELGAWGTIDGDNDSAVVVPMSDLNDNSFLVGSVDNAKVQQARRAKMDATSDSAPVEPSSRVLIVADESKVRVNTGTIMMMVMEEDEEEEDVHVCGKEKENVVHSPSQHLTHHCSGCSSFSTNQPFSLSFSLSHTHTRSHSLFILYCSTPYPTPSHSDRH